MKNNNYRAQLKSLRPLILPAFFVFDGLVVLVASRLALQAFDIGPLRVRLAVALSVAIGLSVFVAGNIYRPRRLGSVLHELQSIALLWSLAMLVIVTTVALSANTSWMSSNIVLAWWVFPLISLLAFRGSIRELMRRLRKAGIDSQYVVLVGAGDTLRKAAGSIRAERWSGVRLVGYFGDVAEVDSSPCLGDAAGLEGYLEAHDVDELWLAFPIARSEQVLNILETVNCNDVELKYIPDSFGDHLMHCRASHFGELPVINLQPSRVRGLSALAKSTVDKVLALLAVVLLSPLLLAVVLAIRLTSPGPAVFKQLRAGIAGERITVYKFRTMKLHEEQLDSYQQAKRGDDRITPIGHFLRKSSVDELPQLFNVLKGEMSLVGPRPHPLKLNEEYQSHIPNYLVRHRVKPGITGLAQVNGFRGETDTMEKMERRIEYDLRYIKEWSLWLDFRILLLTVVRLPFGVNAY
jgi:Undecaprenyl-phosphate glucose phosphotransferase